MTTVETTTAKAFDYEPPAIDDREPVTGLLGKPAGS